MPPMANYEIDYNSSKEINHNPSEVIDYKSSEELAESEYQVRWSKVMDRGNYRKSSSYKKVEVLMLRWADTCDNLDVSNEVNSLKAVFEDLFHYNAKVVELRHHKLQPFVNHVVASWIFEHNVPETLLIVYYAGHGKPGIVPGQLQFHGRTSPNDEQQKEVNHLVWNKTEQLLKDATEPNVLEIFDCCYAGYLAQGRGGSRSFEYIAATQHDKTTRVPGDDSFTSALIWALENLVKEKPEGKFTTVELLNKIKNDAPNLPEDQVPMLFGRENPKHSGRIMLHPLQRHPEDDSESSPQVHSLKQDAKKHTLTLHFDLAEKMDLSSFERFGDEFNELFGSNISGVNYIRYGGMRPTGFAHAVKRFQTSLNKRRLSQKSPKDSNLLTPNSLKAQSPRWSDSESIAQAAIASSQAVESSEGSEDQGKKRKKLILQKLEVDSPVGKRARRSAKTSSGNSQRESLK